jgi:hypothetical protein
LDIGYDPVANKYYCWRYYVPNPGDPRGELIRFDPISGLIDSLGYFPRQNRLNEQRGNLDFQNHLMLIPNVDPDTDDDSLIIFNLSTQHIDSIIPYCSFINYERLIGPSAAFIKSSGSKLEANYGVNYEWFLDGNTLPGNNQQVLENADAGWYKVAIKYADGIIDTSSEVYFDFNTGVQNVNGSSQPQFISSPNPLSDFSILTLKTEIKGEFDVQLFNSEGIKYRQFVLHSNIAYQFERDELQSGVYNIRILHGKSLLGIWKLIVL